LKLQDAKVSVCDHNTGPGGQVLVDLKRGELVQREGEEIGPPASNSPINGSLSPLSMDTLGLRKCTRVNRAASWQDTTDMMGEVLRHRSEGAQYCAGV
ncbi:unnamed protein product, partial [Chrysoparadoxa australica]